MQIRITIRDRSYTLLHDSPSEDIDECLDEQILARLVGFCYKEEVEHLSKQVAKALSYMLNERL